MSLNEHLATQILKQDALSSSGSQPVYLTKVEVNGADSFSREFFGKLLAPLVEESDYTLKQLVQRTEDCFGNLQKALVFRSVAPSVHVDYMHLVPDLKSYNKDKPIPTRVVFDLEAGDLSSGDATLGFNTQDNLVVDLGYTNNNFNHNGELVKIGVNYRPYKPAEHLVSTMRLVLGLRNPAYKFLVDLYSSQDNNQQWQQSLSKATGGVLGVSFLNTAKTVSVFGGLALTKRTVYDVQDDLLEHAGDFLKSSALARLSFSNVGYLGQLFPANGVTATVSSEISSDQEQEPTSTRQAFFAKTAGKLDLYKSFLRNRFTAHLFSEAGAIYASAGNSFGVHLCDRFYLGGIGSLPGFARNSVNTSGGTQYYKAGMSLFTRIPSFVHEKPTNETSPLRLYATGAVGNVGDNLLAESGACSAGVGLRYFNEWVSLDAGYFVAQRLQSSSVAGIRDGFQLELSLGGTTRVN